MLRWKPARFSLLELTTALAIVMVLAALALPGFARAVVDVRFVEAEVVTDGIRSALRTVRESGEMPNTIYSGSWSPDAFPSKALRPWNATGPGWAMLPFEPDGDVRCSYRFSYDEEGGAYGTCALIEAVCDVDGDGEYFSTWSFECESTTLSELYVYCSVSNWDAWKVGVSGWPTFAFPCR